MNVQPQNILIEIIERAKKESPVSFKLIRTWREYVALRGIRRVTRSVVKSLESGRTNLIKTYCKEVTTQSADVTKLLVYNTLSQTLAFYSKNLETLTDMIDEYEMYLLAGNFMDFFFLTQRPDNKLWDHRRL